MARILPDLRGLTFGRLYALRRVKTLEGSKWYCFCSCGNRVLAMTGVLRNGNKRSCGCLRTESLAVARAERVRKREMDAGVSIQDTQDTQHSVEQLDAINEAAESLGIDLHSQ